MSIGHITACVGLIDQPFSTHNSIDCYKDTGITDVF